MTKFLDAISGGFKGRGVAMRSPRYIRTNGTRLAICSLFVGGISGCASDGGLNCANAPLAIAGAQSAITTSQGIVSEAENKCIGMPTETDAEKADKLRCEKKAANVRIAQLVIIGGAQATITAYTLKCGAGPAPAAVTP